MIKPHILIMGMVGQKIEMALAWKCANDAIDAMTKWRSYRIICLWHEDPSSLGCCCFHWKSFSYTVFFIVCYQDGRWGRLQIGSYSLESDAASVLVKVPVYP